MLKSMNDFRADYMAKERQALADYIADAPTKGRLKDGWKEGPPGAMWGWKGPFMAGYGLGEDIRLAARRAKLLGTGQAATDSNGQPISGNDLFTRAEVWLKWHWLQQVDDFWRMYAVKGRGPGEGTNYWRAYNYDALPAPVQQQLADEWREGNLVMLAASDAAGNNALDPYDYTLVLQTHQRTSSGWKPVFDDSDYGRHDHRGPAGDYLRDPDITSALTEEERNKIEAMLLQTVQDKVEEWGAKPLKATERHRMHYPILTMLAYYRYAKKFYRDQAADDARALGEDVVDRVLRSINENGGAPEPQPPLTEQEIIDLGWAEPEDTWSDPMVKWNLARQALGTCLAAYTHAFLRTPAIEAGPKGDQFRVWDMSEPDDPEFHSLNNIRSDWAWYIGHWGQVFYFMALEEDVPEYVKTHIVWVYGERYKWCSRDDRLPRAKLEADGSGPEVQNGLMHGGKLPDASGKRWIREGDTLMTPREFWEMDPNTVHHPMTYMVVHETDQDGYQQSIWPTGAGPTPGSVERQHYPRSQVPIGPKLDITGGSWAAMADFMFMKFLTDGKVESLEMALMVTSNYYDWNHLLYSGETLSVKRSQALRKWYGTAAGTSRAFYWLFSGSQILKQFVFDFPGQVYAIIRAFGNGDELLPDGDEPTADDVTCAEAIIDAFGG